MNEDTYEKAVNWIAYEDDSECLDEKEIAQYLTTTLVADVWRVDPNKLAKEILRRRLDRSVTG